MIDHGPVTINFMWDPRGPGAGASPIRVMIQRLSLTEELWYSQQDDTIGTSLRWFGISLDSHIVDVGIYGIDAVEIAEPTAEQQQLFYEQTWGDLANASKSVVFAIVA